MIASRFLRPRAVLVSALMSLVSVPAFAAPTPFSQKPFTDVPPEHPQYQAIEYLRTNNLLKGYLDGTFRPTRRLSRAEFVQLMTNELFLPSRDADCVAKNTGSGSTTVFFPDVRADAAFATDICVAKTNNLIHGYDDGYFRPQRSLSFVEAAKVIVSTFRLQMRRDKIGDERWYEVYVQTLRDYRAVPESLGIHSGITRGQVAEIIYNLREAQRNQ